MSYPLFTQIIRLFRLIIKHLRVFLLSKAGILVKRSKSVSISSDKVSLLELIRTRNFVPADGHDSIIVFSSTDISLLTKDNLYTTQALFRRFQRPTEHNNQKDITVRLFGVYRCLAKWHWSKCQYSLI